MRLSAPISGNVLDILHETIYPATLEIRNGSIAKIARTQGAYQTYILPGFVDAHVHIESSMLVPSEFARLAVRHGTVATVSDPHEIANVLGTAGVQYMIDNGKAVPFKFCFGAPSSVPATSFETAGAEIDAAQVDALLASDEIRYLSEMMNFPGVLTDDQEVMAKINSAKRRGKVIDGHAPGLRGDALAKYVNAGVSTDHESIAQDEALEKIRLGMKILIREGSAAKNFDSLVHLIDAYPEQCMLCSDDKHPDDLARGHINDLVRRGVQAGANPMKVLRCACVNPVRHYGLDVGLLREGDAADFIVVDDLVEFNILQTVIDGQVVAQHGKTLLSRALAEAPNVFAATKKTTADFSVKPAGRRLQVIEAIDRQLITNRRLVTPTIVNGRVVADPARDILKIAVVNRHQDAVPAVGFIRNFGLQTGAIASSVAHDSHNVVAVGASDEHLCRAVNVMVEHRGGLAVVADDLQEVLPLPVAGLMSVEDGLTVAEQYARIDQLAKGLGSSLGAPFMTLSFMALLVVPSIKISDRGLFDGQRFAMTSLFAE